MNIIITRDKTDYGMVVIWPECVKKKIHRGEYGVYDVDNLEDQDHIHEIAIEINPEKFEKIFGVLPKRGSLNRYSFEFQKFVEEQNGERE